MQQRKGLDHIRKMTSPQRRGHHETRNFEGLELPVAAENHKFLTQTYGDYMQLPPERDRVIKHVLKVDFGSY